MLHDLWQRSSRTGAAVHECGRGTFRPNVGSENHIVFGVGADVRGNIALPLTRRRPSFTSEHLRAAALRCFRSFDPGPGAVPPVVFSTTRAAHTHFDFRKCTKYHGPGVDRLSRSWTPNEDVAFDAVLGRRQDCVERVGRLALCGSGLQPCHKGCRCTARVFRHMLRGPLSAAR